MSAKPFRPRRRKPESGGIQGQLTLTARGFGFVRPESGPDILIPYNHLGVAASGDTVQVETFPESARDKPAGKIVNVLQRNDAPIVGRIRRRKGEIRVYPEDQRVPRALVLTGQDVSTMERSLRDGSLKDGDVVRVKLREWNDPGAHPRGELLDLVGRADEPGIDLRVIAIARGFALQFPHAVESAAESVRMPPPRKVLRGTRRKDLRKLTCFTIDPDTAKDFDDALSITQRDDGLFELGVHIADVSHFVTEGSDLDREARARATSVYLVNEVLPMLPEHLSNGVCSLVPGQPRLAFSVLVVLDSSGTVHEFEITESVIQSSRRFTYQEVEEILQGETDPLASELHVLHLVAQMLGRRRRENGSVDMDLPAATISLDEEGVPVSIRPVERLQANRLVEECMLLANRQVAECVQNLSSRRKHPFIYRIHPQPKETDVAQLLELLHHLGIRYQIDDEVQPEDYRNILALIENLEFKDLVEKLALKSLTKAVYSTENEGHFGLALDAYTHFTSPIRRYPDLVVHRLLKRYLASEKWGVPRGLQKDLEEVCRHASERERAATEAEREFTRLKSLEYLAGKIGREYDGVVSGVTAFGVFVQLNRYLVEGLVHVSRLGSERFELNRDGYRLEGADSESAFTLGDRVRVRVLSVNLSERKADFDLVQDRP